MKLSELSIGAIGITEADVVVSRVNTTEYDLYYEGDQHNVVHTLALQLIGDTPIVDWIEPTKSEIIKVYGRKNNIPVLDLKLSKVCTCEYVAMLRDGCKCGAIEPYQVRY